MSSLPHPLDRIVPFLFVLGVLIFIHELGHYLAARWRGVHVETFSIGFGRALTSWRDRRGTLWKLAWIPLGGYVKLHGQERPEDATAEQRAAWQPGRTFNEKSVLSRAIIIAGGPVANFLLAAILFSVLFGTIGQAVTRDVAEVGVVVPESPAARAGLRSGDRIEAIDDEAVTTFADLQRVISVRAGVDILLHIRRDGVGQSLPARTDAKGDPAHPVGSLGIAAPTETQTFGPVAAVMAGVAHTWDTAAQILQGLWQLISGQRGVSELGGPLRIAQISGQVAQLGVASLVGLIALLSVNLGLLNLLPIPVLDGGHLMFLLAEAVRGRPLPPRALEYGFRAGLAFIAMLFVFVTWNDLTQIGLFRWVAGLIG